MTAILEEIRQLDAARKRGDISAKEYATERERILASVEDADVTPTFSARPRPQPAARAAPARPRSAPGPASRPVTDTPNPSSGPSAGRPQARPETTVGNTVGNPDDITSFWGLIFIGLCAAGLMTFLIGRLIGDITIALTLAITVFAAIVIAAFQRMQT
ncbi:SHOCT domain-containing protein [Phaeobacter sp. B1627]|nr:SHOCT domain-containing protein [Phaeobacter sp. B1627]